MKTEYQTQTGVMKCQKFQFGKMQYPAIAQPKISGVRAWVKSPSV